MAEHEVGLAAGVAFEALYARLEQLGRDRARLEEETFADLGDRLIAEVRARFPKFKKAPPARAADATSSSHYGALTTWATGAWGSAAILEWGTAAIAPARAKAEEIEAQVKATKEELEELGPYAVFLPVFGAQNVIHRVTDYDFAGQGTGAGGYVRARADLYALVLRVRGFTVEVRSAGRGGLDVIADAPPIVAKAARYWRVDDVRMLAVTKSQNLKVLFSPFFPYAGPWDWPEKDRETRDSPSFAVHKANEEAHFAAMLEACPPGEAHAGLEERIRRHRDRWFSHPTRTTIDHGTVLVVDGFDTYAVAACCNCRDRVTFNPDTVPSIWVEGIKRPLCRACFDRWNRLHRVSQGLAPVPLHPSAYKEGDNEP